VFLKCYYWTKDKKTIAGQDDISQDPSIVLDAEKEGRVPANHYLCCGDDANGVVGGCKTSKPLPVSKPEDGWLSWPDATRATRPSSRFRREPLFAWSGKVSRARSPSAARAATPGEPRTSVRTRIWVPYSSTTDSGTTRTAG
jgi:hypothetical protein